MKSGIRAACEYVKAHIDESLPLRVLARVAGMSSFHFLRSFKAAVGVTPKRYVDEVRLKRFKTGLKNSQGVAAAVYDAGYGSASRVYERADTRLGMTPAQYRRGGEGVKISHATVATPVGLMMVAATDRGLCFVQFGDDAQALLRQLCREYSNADITPIEHADDPHLAAWVEALSKHLEIGGPHLDLPVDVRATAFQMRVWAYLQSIPSGEVQSYGEVAQAIGRRGACGCARVRFERVRDRHSVPPGHSRNGSTGRLYMGTRSKARIDRPGARAPKPLTIRARRSSRTVLAE